MTTIPMSPRQLAAFIMADVTGGDSVEAAVREGRCVKAPMGCGKTIEVDRSKKAYAFPNEAYKAEWKLTGMCPACQDRLALNEGEQAEDGDTIVRGMD